MIINKNSVINTLSKRLKEHECTPMDIPGYHLLKDADKAGKRIAEAIKNKEEILLIGDYDVDGVTSTAIIVDFFRQINYPIKHKIPNRFLHGYGLKKALIENTTAKIIITVDNGITSIEAGEYCTEKGIDLIITDHHTPLETLPKAYAIVNPKQNDCHFPFKEICGAQVAWYLTKAIENHIDQKLDKIYFFDLLVLAIVADVMPLTGINREMVKIGLKAIKKSNRPFFQAAKMMLGENITSEWIAFQLAPMINASGRMKDAKFSLKAMLSETFEEASFRFNKLIKLNKIRKDVERSITFEAIQYTNKNDNFIILDGYGLHEGVVGIVAARLTEIFKKPAIVLTNHKDVLKGSGRTFGDFHLFNAVNSANDLLVGFGGHAAACGLAIRPENLEEFKYKMNEIARNTIINDIDEAMMGIIHPRDITIDFYEELKIFEPFGEGNVRPKFKFENALITEVKVLGENKNHIKLTLSIFFLGKEYKFEALKFNFLEIVNIGDVVSFSFYIQINDFNNQKKVQLFIEEMQIINV